MDKILHKELSYEIMGLCFAVHNELGRFCKEKQYANRFEELLIEKDIKYRRECNTKKLKQTSPEGNRIDFIIENKVIIEFKAKRLITKEDYYQTQRYLQSSNKDLGLLINFRDRYLKAKRVLNSREQRKVAIGGDSQHSHVFADSDRTTRASGGDSQIRIGSNKTPPNPKGFTLLEILLSIAIASILFAVVGSLFVSVLQNRVKMQSIAEIEETGMQIVQLLTQSIRNAEGINSPAAAATGTSLSLDVVTAGDDPTVFDLNSGAIRIKEGAAAAINLSSSKMTASALSFQNVSGTNAPGSVTYTFTLTLVNPEGRNEYTYAKTFTGATSLRKY
jgi:GxxExxY protein